MVLNHDDANIFDIFLLNFNTPNNTSSSSEGAESTSTSTSTLRWMLDGAASLRTLWLMTWTTQEQP